MGLFGKSNKEKELEKQNEILRTLLAAEKTKQRNPNAGKMKLKTIQCKYCGYRVTLLANGIIPASFCPKRGKNQPHVWQTLGYQYK